MKKITVVGGGNAGCLTALYCAWHGKGKTDTEVELIHNPDIQTERVGQATALEAPALLWGALGFNWYDNNINATFKSGILYEGWGKVKDKLFHSFPADNMAMHYCPWEMQAKVLTSGHFKVKHTNTYDLDKIDSDYIFDCRGKPKDYSEYDELKNPINACILGKPNWNTCREKWSRHVATPNGWTFVIPTYKKSPSHDYCVGYCYNSKITKKKDAEKNFQEMFDVEITKHLNFKNYVAKEPIIDGRIFLNGNRLFFLEPLESTASQAYTQVSRAIFNHYIPGRNTTKYVSNYIKGYIKELETFVLWHYQFGSKYDTPFWDYAKTLRFEPHGDFEKYIAYSKISDCIPEERYGGRTQSKTYGQWPPVSIKTWHEGMTKYKDDKEFNSVGESTAT